MKLEDLIKHYDDKTLPKPAYATLCALRRLAPVEPLRWGVQCDGVIIAAFRLNARAEQFAAMGRRDTPAELPIEVVDLDSFPHAAAMAKQGGEA